MRIETRLPVRHFVIHDAQRLDPVRVYLENYEPGKGRITITCYGSAWSGYWGAMGGDTIEKFFIRCDSDYLAGNLGSSQVLSRAKHNVQYLVRVIEAVQAALREQEWL